MAATQTQTMLTPIPTSSQQVSHNLFMRIEGDQRTTMPIELTLPDVASSKEELVDTTWSYPPTNQGNNLQEMLKYDRTQEIFCSNKKRKTQPHVTKKPTKRISFEEKVKVVPIPMRDEYSTRIRTSLWSDAKEIYLNAARNTIEFASEGWNWRTVTEDEGMYICLQTGAMIHPCHYANCGLQPGEQVPM